MTAAPPWVDRLRGRLGAEDAEVPEADVDRVVAACRRLPATAPPPQMNAEDRRLWLVWELGGYRLELNPQHARFAHPGHPADEPVRLPLGEGLWLWVVVLWEAMRVEELAACPPVVRDQSAALRFVGDWAIAVCRWCLRAERIKWGGPCPDCGNSRNDGPPPGAR